MRRGPAITRRGFIGALGVASTGFGLPSIVNARGAKEAEPALLRLHRNESPYGLPPLSAQAIHEITESRSNRYPIEEPTALAEAIAHRLGVAKEQVLLGCGSTEILKIASETFCSPSGAAVVAEPTFEAVVTYCPLAHARAVKIPLTKAYKHDLARMLDTATLVGGFLYFCNPSNPAGTFIDKREVEKFVRIVPSGVVLLVDEAYIDYVDSAEYESCLRYVKEGLPILVSRTFSKVYGMAGLRVGYSIGHKDLIRQMEPRRLAVNTNQLATAAALAALKEEGFVTRVRKLNAQVRSYLCDELRALGLEFIPSQTNFVMVDLGRPAEPAIDALKKRGILVGRLFPSMPHHMRVTLGTGDEMKFFVKEFKEVLNSLPS
jgi:histidinol-phosphate aminotransferase